MTNNYTETNNLAKVYILNNIKLKKCLKFK